MTVLNSPFKGKWMLFNPPRTEPGHYLFVKLNKLGRIYSPFSNVNHMFLRCATHKFEAYGEEVYAPENLEIVDFVDGFSDKEAFNFFIDLLAQAKPSSSDRKDWGNYLVARLTSGKYLVLKHLQGMPKWQAGQRVEKGELLAKVGASGSLAMPGLGMSIYLEAELQNVDKIAFANVVDREKKEYSLFYPTQSKSFSQNQS